MERSKVASEMVERATRALAFAFVSEAVIGHPADDSFQFEKLDRWVHGSGPTKREIATEIARRKKARVIREKFKESMGRLGYAV